MSDGPYPRPPRTYPPRAPDDAEQRAPSSDPLLELARLIGQSDPFAPPPARGGDSPRGMPDLPTRGPMARPPSRAMAPEPDRYQADREREEPQARPHPFPSLQILPSRSFDDHARDDHSRDDYRRDDDTRDVHARDDHAGHDRGGERYFEPAPVAAAPAAHERFEFPELGGPAPGRMPHGPSAYPGETYPTVPDQHYPAEPELAYRQDEHYPNPGNAGPEAPREDLRQDAAYPQGGEYERQYADAEGNRYDEYEYADGEEGAYEDDEPGGKRRNAIKIGLAVLGVVVFGSAAAFGYRMVFGGATDGPPPLIRADTSPTKVMATASADGSAKPINDRLGNGSGERMLSREEQPIDLRDATRNANGGLVVPLTGGGAVAPYPSASTAGAATPAGPTTGEPKRVRTVTIHADPAPPAGAGVAPAAPAAAAAPRTAAPRPAQAPQAAAPSPSAAPLAPAPQSQPSVAAVEPARPPAPARAPRTSEVGGWVVQISAQKTEGEAQSAFRVAQSKYSVLSGYQPLIRKKDQGDRGVFYATQVGPLPRDEANQLCENLKSAGGNCFIQRN
jgi:SPOR domain